MGLYFTCATDASEKEEEIHSVYICMSLHIQEQILVDKASQFNNDLIIYVDVGWLFNGLVFIYLARFKAVEGAWFAQS